MGYIASKLPFASDRDLAFLAAFIRSLKIEGFADGREIARTLVALGVKGNEG